MLTHLNEKAKTRGEESIRSRDRIWSEFGAKGMKFRAYTTLGQYDVITVVEAPSEELMLQFLMAAWGTGDVETQTLRAFTDDEVRNARKGQGSPTSTSTA